MAIENSETREKKNIKTVMVRNAPQLRIDVGQDQGNVQHK